MRFEDCSRLPAPEDNVAIAVQRLEAGTTLTCGDQSFVVRHTVLEGHRFAYKPIAEGEPLLSWGLPFGDATRAIAAGDYLCNDRILQALGERDIDFELPGESNFVDRFEPYELGDRQIVPGQQVAQVADPGTFLGYERPGNRGTGTRNFLVILGLTSADAALATAVAERTREQVRKATDDCEVVAVTHTEGGGKERPHNLDFILRTLAGFCVHGNTGAVLVLDHCSGAYDLGGLETFMHAEGYRLDHVPHAFVSAQGSFSTAMDRAMAAVQDLWPQATAAQRSEQPLSGLRLALQCGGSDAFSGVSGNSLAGVVAKELIKNGGGANLAETDELIGAESYVLHNVRGRDVAVRFLDKIATFKERAERHGASAEGNPSGGNNYRGLYNIALKSLGAARKKDPDVRLDHVLDYGQPMHEGGYYFMDSPGNDLESIAGQVASGCNLILFITGNGSITNFPFVPTLKFVTTTGRFELMSNEMDVNAGRYNDGMAMADLGRETFDLVCRVASGERTKGEAAGHSQVSIWREWRQDDDSRLTELQAEPKPSGEPLRVVAGQPIELTYEALAGARGPASEQIGLIMPTSLCSGQIAELIAKDCNARGNLPGSLSRFVALAHSEGCGSANAEELYLQTMLGHLRHPFTRRALLLEHGCEKTHNDAIRHWLHEHGHATSDYGFASVQLDGGIERVRERVIDWFAESLAESSAAASTLATAADLRVAIVSSGAADAALVDVMAALIVGVVAVGGTVVLADNDGLLQDERFVAAVLQEPDVAPSLAYGQYAERSGLHVMRAPTEDLSETVTGLGGTGVEIMLGPVGHAGDVRIQTHPMIPMLQFGVGDHLAADLHGDLDLVLAQSNDLQQLLDLVSRTASRTYETKSTQRGQVRFQLTRGELGVSL